MNQKNKSNTFQIIITFMVLITPVILIFLISYYIFSTPFSLERIFDQPSEIKISDQNYPLDGSHQYIIQRNVLWRDQNNEIVCPENSFFVLSPINENYSDRMGADYVAGRKIGNSKVDFSNYLDKPVFIEGKHYWGTPISPNVNSMNEKYLKPQVVVQINSIKEVN